MIEVGVPQRQGVLKKKLVTEHTENGMRNIDSNLSDLALFLVVAYETTDNRKFSPCDYFGIITSYCSTRFARITQD